MELLLTALAIAACILLFSLAIFIHEFGHFLAARRLGLKVDAFSIGFGPAIWKKKIGGVEYRIACIPFGGYVALPELDPEGTKALEGQKDGDGEEIPETPQPAVELPPWKKITVAFMGPFGNIVLAIALAFVLAAVPNAQFGETPAEIGEVIPGGPAETAGIRPGDKVIAVNGNAVRSWTDMSTEIQLSGGKAVPFTIDRGGQETVLSVEPAQHAASGIWYIMALSTTNGTPHAAAWMPARNPLKQLEWDTMSIVRVLKALATPREASAAAKALGGPVMIAEGLYRQVRRDVWDALGFLRFLCINLAILNLLPIPVLDGGLIFFALVELVTRRKVPRRLVDGLSKAFMYLLLAAMLFLVYRDISRSVKIHRAANAAAETEEAQNPEPAAAAAPAE